MVRREGVVWKGKKSVVRAKGEKRPMLLWMLRDSNQGKERRNTGGATGRGKRRKREIIKDQTGGEGYQKGG